MDKDLASAIMLERCSCYDKALDAAKRVLAKSEPDSDDSFWARKIIHSLGEEFMKQRFVDKAMECYQALTDHHHTSHVECPEIVEVDTFTGLGPDSVEVRTHVSQDVYDLMKEVRATDCCSSETDEDLLREAVYLLILKYATQKDVREKLFKILAKVIEKD